MVKKGWDVVVDYYQNKDTKTWVPYSRQLTLPPVGPTAVVDEGKKFNTLDFALRYVVDGVAKSWWHDVSLRPDGAAADANQFNFIVEIPLGSTAKMEVNKKAAGNPIMHDEKKGVLRSYTYGATFFNYGLLPQTWEDPAVKNAAGAMGDNDPLDVMEVGSVAYKMGDIVPVKVLGDLELIDQGELDHKILVIALSDPDAAAINTIADLKTVKPGYLEKIVDWLKMYKTTDGKAINELTSDEPTTVEQALTVISECNAAWDKLAVKKEVADTGFSLP